MRNALLFTFALAATLPVLSQAAPAPDLCAAAPQPVYDVVSIKPTDSPSRNSSFQGQRDGFIYTGAMRRLVLQSFAMRDFQVAGGPDWVSDATWNIAAKMDAPPPDYATMSPAEQKAAADRQVAGLRAMLMDRFKLKCHMTTKELPIYELVQAKGGSKLKEATEEESKRNSSSSRGSNLQMHLTMTGVSMERIATQIAGQLDRLVVDKTGLTGSYNLTMDYVRDTGVESQNTDAPAGPTIFTALEEQLGLKLVPAKGPVPVLVIDSAEKPSQN